jgi:5-methylcytosine-specific restriction enzyme A
MKPLLLFITAALLAFAAPAMAAPPVPVDVLPTTMVTLYHEGLPPEAIGSTYDLWCYIEEIKAYRRKDCRIDGFSDSWMSLDGQKYEGPRLARIDHGHQHGATAMRIRDLPHPVTASKSDWIGNHDWIGFTPTDGSLTARNKCQSNVQRQFGRGYIMEYITEDFPKPNLGFETDPQYLAEQERHDEFSGRLIGVHKLRTTALPLRKIVGEEKYESIQNMWATTGNRHRWGVAFPIVESYRIKNSPKAKDVLGASYAELYAYRCRLLRELNDVHRAAIADLEIERVPTSNAWIGDEEDFERAEYSRLHNLLDEDFSNNSAWEGEPAERRARYLTRAVGIARDFIKSRTSAGTLRCDADDCEFDPATRPDCQGIRPRTLLDAHHNNPLANGARSTAISDFSLLCPTCHRIADAKLRALRRESTVGTSSHLGSASS